MEDTSEPPQDSVGVAVPAAFPSDPLDPQPTVAAAPPAAADIAIVDTPQPVAALESEPQAPSEDQPSDVNTEPTDNDQAPDTSNESSTKPEDDTNSSTMVMLQTINQRTFKPDETFSLTPPEDLDAGAAGVDVDSAFGISMRRKLKFQSHVSRLSCSILSVYLL